MIIPSADWSFSVFAREHCTDSAYDFLLDTGLATDSRADAALLTKFFYLQAARHLCGIEPYL